MKLKFVLAMLAAAVVSVRAEEAKKEAAAAPAAPAAEVKLGDAAKGKPIYDMYCFTCHGTTGKGDGIAAAALNPKPRDFTDKKIMDTISNEAMIKVIQLGGAALGKSPMMTPWGAVLKEDQIKDVGAYVRTLAK